MCIFALSYCGVFRIKKYKFIVHIYNMFTTDDL